MGENSSTPNGRGQFDRAAPSGSLLSRLSKAAFFHVQRRARVGNGREIANGDYQVYVGAPSRDVRLTGSLRIQQLDQK